MIENQIIAVDGGGGGGGGGGAWLHSDSYTFN